MTFQELNIAEPILKALNEKKYSTPTPIQEKAIPEALKKRDILGIAQTGTGKTAAFAIPIIQLLCQEKPNRDNREIRALILTDRKSVV